MLTKEQLIERRKGIGASDAAKIMNGEWYDLWAEKTGKVEPEDLSGVWPVQLGSHTESLNLDWYERKTGHKAINRGVAVKCEIPFLRCTLDAQDKEDDTIIEAKHVNGFSKIDEVRARYSPQVQHQMYVCGVRRAILTVIIGASEPVLEVIERDDFWLTEYLDKCKQFWHFVETDIPPPGGPVAMVFEPEQPKKLRSVDFSKDNRWVSSAKDWLDNKAANKKFDDAAKALRSKVPADVGTATGGGVIISRSKDNKLLIKETKENA